MQKTQGLLSLIARALGWVCCCCWTVGGSSQPSAIRCHSSANRSRAARVCSFSVACAASKHVLARRRYSSPLLVTAKAPSTRQTAHTPRKWPREAHPAGPQRVLQCDGASHPRATLQLASVKWVPARRLILGNLSRLPDSGKPAQD